MGVGEVGGGRVGRARKHGMDLERADLGGRMGAERENLETVWSLEPGGGSQLGECSL